MRATKASYCNRIFEAILEGYVLLEMIRDAKGEVFDCRIMEINSQAEAMIELSSGEVIGKTLSQILSSFDEYWLRFGNQIPQGQELIQFEFYAENINKYFSISAFIDDRDMLVLFFMDVTLQKKAQDALRIHEVLFDNAQDIMLYIKPEGQILNANKKACDEYGYTKQQLLAMSIQDIRHPSTIHEYDQQMKQAAYGGIVFESIHVRKDGSSFPVEVSAKSTFTARGPLRLHIIRNITKRKENEKQITWLANYDALTGIPNRRSFIAHLEEEISRCLRSETAFALMLFDIDKFKYINDRYGHEAGDMVLRHAATAAQKVLRAEDQIGRLGGDEFVVLQTNIRTQDDIIALAERIQAAVGEPIHYKEIALSIKISIGISLFPKDAPEADGLLHCADTAMYQAKHTGGGSYCFFAVKPM